MVDFILEYSSGPLRYKGEISGDDPSSMRGQIFAAEEKTAVGSFRATRGEALAAPPAAAPPPPKPVLELGGKPRWLVEKELGLRSGSGVVVEEQPAPPVRALAPAVASDLTKPEAQEKNSTREFPVEAPEPTSDEDFGVPS